MSLVSLSSESSVISNFTQPSFNFKNFFPQPLLLKPHSQVCLSSITFSGFSGEDYNIVGSLDPTLITGNNKLLFGFGDTEFTSDYDVAVLRVGVYDGTALAVEIARAMNEANRLKHFVFSVNFTGGNPQSNPITVDSFSISYTEGIEAVYGPGDWTRSRTVPNANVTFSNFGNHSTTFPEQATKIQIADVPVPAPGSDDENTAVGFSWTKGLAQYVPIDEHGGGSAHFTVFSDGNGDLYDSAPQIASQTCGVLRPSFIGRALLGSIGDIDTDMLFSAGAGDIIINTHYNNTADKNTLSIIMSQPKAKFPIWNAASNGTPSKAMRIVDLTNIIETKQDVLLVKVTPFYPTCDYIVQLYRSRDRGETYTILPNGTGGNNTGTDTEPKIYTEDMGNEFSPFEGCVYTTRGIANNIADTQFINAYDPSTVTMIPFVRFPREAEFSGENQNIIKSLDLTSDLTDTPCESTLSLNAGTLPPRVADNVYTIQFDYDPLNGYEGTIGITDPENDPLNPSGVPSTEINGKAFARDTTQKGFTNWLIYTDNSVPIATATHIGTMVLDPATRVLTISGFFNSGESFVGPIDGGGVGQPTTVVEPYYCVAQSMENVDDSVMYRLRNDFKIGELSKNAYSLVYDTLPTNRYQAATVNLDYTIDNASRFITGQVTQNDVSLIGDGANRRLQVGPGRVGTVQESLGFKNTSYELASGSTTLNTDTKPLKDLPIGEKQIHISIPELSNVKSLEGESSQRYKTIKVLPKTVFTESEEDSVVSYAANYEDWIDINNTNEQQINELTIQLRNADGKLAKFVDGTTRTTIKFREDPEKKQERMFDMLARKITQSQNPGQEILIDPGTFRGS